jgi:hypothetical protein
MATLHDYTGPWMWLLLEEAKDADKLGLDKASPLSQEGDMRRSHRMGWLGIAKGHPTRE